MVSIFWTEEEVERLRKLYAVTRADDLVAEFGRDIHAIWRKANSIGLKKSKDYAASVTRDRWAEGRHENSRKAHFAKGTEAWNKGKAWADWMKNPEASRATQFKAGRAAQEARNYQPIGTLRITKDGYLERKVSDDLSVYPARRWVALHRLVWETVHGPIPPDHVVVFRAGMKTIIADEVTIDRLELLTRAELMRRNSYHTHLSPELARLVQLRGAVQRQINKQKKEASNGK